MSEQEHEEISRPGVPETGPTFDKDKFLLMLDFFDFIKDKDIKAVKQAIEAFSGDEVGMDELAILKGQKIAAASQGFVPPGIVV